MDDMNQITTGKMGVKGHVVMPQNVREMLGVGVGSTIAWVVTDDKRIEVRPVNEDAATDEQEFAEALRAAGLDYSEWRSNRRKHFDKYIEQRRKAVASG